MVSAVLGLGAAGALLSAAGGAIAGARDRSAMSTKPTAKAASLHTVDGFIESVSPPNQFGAYIGTNLVFTTTGKKPVVSAHGSGKPTTVSSLKLYSLVGITYRVKNGKNYATKVLVLSTKHQGLPARGQNPIVDNATGVITSVTVNPDGSGMVTLKDRKAFAIFQTFVQPLRCI
jgi:hypothetical protein